MKGKNRLELFFGNQSSPGLYRTVFHIAGTPSPIIGVRGTTIPTFGLPFMWAPASQALAIFFISAVKANLIPDSDGRAPLIGQSASPVGTLARLLKKRATSWLHDLFGSDISGRSLLHKIIVLGNARGLQHGPMTASLREDYLSSNDIKIFLDDEDISSNLNAISGLLKSLLDAFEPKTHSPERKARRYVHLDAKASSNHPYVLCAEGES